MNIIKTEQMTVCSYASTNAESKSLCRCETSFTETCLVNLAKTIKLGYIRAVTGLGSL